MGMGEFLVNLDLAVEAGASGFLCGRAIWQDVLPLHPDRRSMRSFLASTAVHNFARANAGRARPGFAHPRLGGWGNQAPGRRRRLVPAARRSTDALSRA